MCTTPCSSTARPPANSRPGRRGKSRRTVAISSGVKLWVAATARSSPSNRYKMLWVASHRRAALRRDRVEHRLNVGGRARDDAQDLARRRLLLERLVRLVEQPDVLDRDDRLSGEGLQERDLLLGEWPDHGSANHNDADRHAFSQQGHRKLRPVRRTIGAAVPRVSAYSVSRSASTSGMCTAAGSTHDTAGDSGRGGGERVTNRRPSADVPGG